MENETNERYENYKNYETFNVATWLSNDSFLHQEALRFINKGYIAFVRHMETEAGNSPIGYQTPDKVSWTDSKLDIETLDRLIGEF